MFFGPLYPWLIVGATRLDPRFARAVDCSVEANHKVRDGAECEVYARPMHLVHAGLLALGVLAIALAAEIMFASTTIFWLTGVLATAALLPDADLFAFVMTESLTFSLLQPGRCSRWRWAGTRRSAGTSRWPVLMLGLLCLARPSFLVLALVLPVLILIGARFVADPKRRSAWINVAAFALGFVLVVGPWIARNYVFGRQTRTDRGIRLRRADRALRLQRHDRARNSCWPSRIACRRSAEPVVDWTFGTEGHRAVRVLLAQELLRRRRARTATSWSRRTAGSIR